VRTTRSLALLVAAYAVGVFVGDGAAPSRGVSTVAIVLALLVVLAASTRRLPRISFLLACSLLFAFGLSRLPAVDWPDDSFLDAECTGRVASAVQGTVGVSVVIVDEVACYRGRDPTPQGGKLRVSVPSPDLAVRTGDRIRVFGKMARPSPALNEGEPDRARALARDGIRYEFRVRDAEYVDVEGTSVSLFGHAMRAAEGVRNSLIARLRGHPERTPAALVAAILLGDRRALEPAAVDNYTVTGILHIIAVSGLHLVFAMWLFVKIARFVARRSERVLLGCGATPFAWVFALPCALFYVLLTGAPSSAVRAIVMIAIAALAILSQRPCRTARALLLTVLVIGLLDPASLFDVSFILSVVSVAALIWLAPALKRQRTLLVDSHALPARLRDFCFATVRTTTAATLGTAPFTAYFFQRIAVAGLVANLVLIPIGSLLLGSSLLWALSEYALPSVAGFVMGLPLGFAQLFNAIASWSSAPSEHLCVTFAPSIVQVIVLALALVFFAARSFRRGLLTVSLLLIVVSIAWESALRISRAPRDAVRVTFLAVGQGDSTLIEFPNGAVMLVDGGGSLVGDDRVGPRVLVPFLRRKRISRVDWVVLSHPHNDHAGGLAAVVKSLDVGEVWASGQPWVGAALEKLKSLISERAIPLYTPPPIPSCDNAQLWLCLVHPVTKPGQPAFFDDLSVNSNSLVLLADFGPVRLLLTGDIEADVESDLAQSRVDVRADLLKVPHHGSRTSSTDDLIGAVRPAIAVASLGRANPFRFPHPVVIDRYRAHGVRLLRTDVDGQISVNIFATYARIRTFLSRQTFTLPQQIVRPVDNPSVGGDSG
jgi:competence protein ComEC